eukprot:TRINITY_DN10574_c0_g1_i1.p1 TRINITY_DN10574_c0_g1~~TRINITY_DN10574_c0_g1_i1.p1  ORF type:complete len:473 (-),score=92.56 TRINITY_DN10574_c0_g1_i1:278-1696(-)
MVHVVVQPALGGELLELNGVHPRCMVSELKAKISNRHSKRIPPRCQKLILDGTSVVLVDSDTLDRHLLSADKLKVNLLVTLEELRRDMAGNCLVSKLKALRTLMGYAHGVLHVSEDMIKSVSALLQDGDAEVRQEAVAALRQIAPHGEENVTLDTLGAHLSHHDYNVRSAAARALVSVSEDWKDQSPIVDILDDLLQSQNVEFRYTALESLSKVAGKGDERALGIFFRCLNDADRDVREQAFSALGAFGGRSQERVVEAILPLLSNQPADVQTTAMHTLANVAQKGDETVLAALIAQLGAPDALVRRAAVNSLGALSTAENSAAVHALCESLGDLNRLVRQEALLSLRAVVGRGHHQVVDAVVAWLESSHKDLREEAANALLVVADATDGYTLGAIAARLHSTFPEVRQAALEAFIEIAPLGNKPIIAAVQQHLDDSSSAVRKKARQALMHLCPLHTWVMIWATRVCCPSSW